MWVMVMQLGFGSGGGGGGGYRGSVEVLGKTNRYPFEIEVRREMGLC